MKPTVSGLWEGKPDQSPNLLAVLVEPVETAKQKHAWISLLSVRVGRRLEQCSNCTLLRRVGDVRDSSLHSQFRIAAQSPTRPITTVFEQSLLASYHTSYCSRFYPEICLGFWTVIPFHESRTLRPRLDA